VHLQVGVGERGDLGEEGVDAQEGIQSAAEVLLDLFVLLAITVHGGAQEAVELRVVGRMGRQPTRRALLRADSIGKNAFEFFRLIDRHLDLHRPVIQNERGAGEVRRSAAFTDSALGGGVNTRVVG